MTHYLHYWRPERFQRAFPGGEGVVRSIASAWYWKFVEGDVVWLLTRGVDDKPLLVGRLVVASPPRRVGVPHYAYGNSKERPHFGVRIAQGSGLRAIQIRWTWLRTLRFDSMKDRIVREGMAAYVGELASLRKLTEGSVTQLAVWWQLPSMPTLSERIAAAFGDPESNARVERAAVACVRAWYEKRGWRVQSRERDRVGYDLECSRRRERLFVEVKGRSSASQQVRLTAGELKAAKQSLDYVLCIVTHALHAPTLNFYVGRALHRSFSIDPLLYQLIPKVKS